MSTTTGFVQNVTAHVLGSELTADAAVGATTLLIDDPADYDATAALLIRVGGDDPAAELVRYTAITEPDDNDDLDDAAYLDMGSSGIAAGFGSAGEWQSDSLDLSGYTGPFWDLDGVTPLDVPVGPSTITLDPTTPLVHAWPAGTRVDVWDAGRTAPGIEWRAIVRPAASQDNDDALDAIVAYPVVGLLPEGVRSDDAAELVTLDDSTGVWVLVNVAGRQPEIQGQHLAAGSIPSGALGFTVGKTTVTISAVAPANPAQGDLWYDTNNGYRMMEWSGSAWVARQYGNSALTADAAARVSLGTVPPIAPNVQDVWVYVDASGGFMLYRWDTAYTDEQGSHWQPLLWNSDSLAVADLIAANISVGTLQGHTLLGQLFGTVGGLDTSVSPPVPVQPVTSLLAVQIGSQSVMLIDQTGGGAYVYTAPTGATVSTTLTAASGTWVCPAGVTSAQVECWGGGGGGAYGDSTRGGAGGGGGEYAKRPSVPLTPGVGYAYQIGQGGAGSPGGGPQAQPGGITRFTADGGLQTTAYDGQPGITQTGGNGGTGSGAGVHYSGGPGSYPTPYPARGGGAGSSASGSGQGVSASGGQGGFAPKGGGNGGDGGVPLAPTPSNGSVPGGGGGGRMANTGPKGADGARGQIILTWTPVASGPQLAASLTGIAQTADPFTGATLARPIARGLKTYRPDLVGLVGGYLEEVNPNAQAITTTPLSAFTLSGPFTQTRLVSDIGSCWNLTTGIWTAPATGEYDFQASIKFVNFVAGSAMALFFLTNGGARTGSFCHFQGTVQDGQAFVSGRRWCAVGDTVVLNVRQATGATQTIDTNSPATYISVRRHA